MFLRIKNDFGFKNGEGNNRKRLTSIPTLQIQNRFLFPNYLRNRIAVERSSVVTIMKIADVKTKSSRTRYNSDRRRWPINYKSHILYCYKYSTTPRYRSCVSRVVTGGSLKRKPTEMDCRKSIRHAESSTVSAKLTFFILFFALPCYADIIWFGVLKKNYFFILYTYCTQTSIYLL